MAQRESDLTVEGLARFHREVADALDLAIAADAPLPLLRKLAAASGFTEALREVPKHALMGGIVSEATAALAEWQKWRNERRATIVA